VSRKLFLNARIFTPKDEGKPLRGKGQGALLSFERGALLVEGGIIKEAGPEDEVLSRLSPSEVEERVDLEGRCVVPGFVDPHTHMCFVGTREEEFAMRLRGATYMEILQAGGGILSTVRAVRSSPREALLEWTRRNVRKALSMGTTTVEIKSGYGLDPETELAMLEVISRIPSELPVDVVPTFMGAHAFPPEFKDRKEAYVDLICDEMLPRVASQGIARFCDVFCENGVFDLEQTERILRRAQELGLGAKMHADEIEDMGGAKLAAKLRVKSADHLLAASEEGLRAMAEAEVVGVLLPATALSLRKPFADARRMIDLGVPVAISTDCNPGSSYCESMPLVFALSVLRMGMSPEEALVASTLNAAHAVGMASLVGSLEPGKQADFLVLDGKTPAALAYRLGSAPVRMVYKRGELVHVSD